MEEVHHEDAGDEAEGELQVSPEDERAELAGETSAPAEVSADVLRESGDDEPAAE